MFRLINRPIRFSVSFDFKTEFSPSKLNTLIKELRGEIQYARKNNIQFVEYQAEFYPDVDIYFGKKTVAGDKFTMTLNPKTIYPKDLDQQKYTIKVTNAGQSQTLTINNATYTGAYNVNEALGILVAQQVRFDTLSIEPMYLSSLNGAKSLFNWLYKNYKVPVYNNWTAQIGYYKVLIEMGETTKQVLVQRKIQKI